VQLCQAGSREPHSLFFRQNANCFWDGEKTNYKSGEMMMTMMSLTSQITLARAANKRRGICNKNIKIKKQRSLGYRENGRWKYVRRNFNQLTLLAPGEGV
jgi:hypothetical protein